MGLSAVQKELCILIGLITKEEAQEKQSLVHVGCVKGYLSHARLVLLPGFRKHNNFYIGSLSIES